MKPVSCQANARRDVEAVFQANVLIVESIPVMQFESATRSEVCTGSSLFAADISDDVSSLKSPVQVTSARLPQWNATTWHSHKDTIVMTRQIDQIL